MIYETNLIGLSIDEATDYAKANGYELHVVQDNLPYLVSGNKIIIVVEKDSKVSQVKRIEG